MTRYTSLGKTGAQMDAEFQRWADSQETRTRCALCPGLPAWVGPAAETREAAREHRATVHPELTRRRRARRPPNPARYSRSQMSEDEEREILADRRRRLHLFSGLILDEGSGG